jgi:hypothetical protein
MTTDAMYFVADYKVWLEKHNLSVPKVLQAIKHDMVHVFFNLGPSYKEEIMVVLLEQGYKDYEELNKVYCGIQMLFDYNIIFPEALIVEEYNHFIQVWKDNKNKLPEFDDEFWKEVQLLLN